MTLTDKELYKQVLGCLIHNPLLLVEYDINIDDFDIKIAKIVFMTITSLLNNGAEKLSCFEIDNEIENHEATATIYRAEGGVEWLQDCDDFSLDANFNFYYNRLKKLSLLRTLQKNNYDISYYYKENPDTLREESELIDRMDEATIEEILNTVENRYNDIRAKFLHGGKNGGDIAGGLQELVDNFSKTPDVGPSLCGSLFSTACRGARPGIFLLRSASTNTGKAIPNYTIIPMADGTNKRVDEVKVGDYLIGSDGKPTKVLNVWPQAEKKQIYKVYFEDGRVAECCEDHLWSYRTLGQRPTSRNNVKPLKDIYEYAKKNGYKNNGNGYRIRIPMNKPAEYPEKTFSISPYVMGLILGDGSFRYTSSQKSFTFSSGTEELPAFIANEFNCLAERNSEKNYNWVFKLNEFSLRRKNLWVEDVLKDYPELWNKKSEDKFIPEEYLYGSIEQRYELLRGLMDTDGSINKIGTIIFTSISKKMVQQVLQLCYSLGFTGKIREDKREEKYTTGVAYCLEIQMYHKDKYKIFKLPRKVARAKELGERERRIIQKKEFMPIVKIEPTDNYTDMTCFTVDAEDALFCMNDYIVTHNTRLSVYDSVKIAFPEHWSFEKGTFVHEIDKNGEPILPRKTLYITTEMDKDEIRTIVLSNLAGVDEEHILTGRYEFGEKERISYAIKIIEKYRDYYFVDQISDPDLNNVSATIKKYATLNGVKFVFFDYVFTSPALLAQFNAARIREDVALALLSNQLKQLAVDYNLFIASSTQVNAKAMEEDGFKDESCIRGM